jgi:hypothetical protein
MESIPCPECGDIPEPRPKPLTYTQAMSDNGVLPSVGMMFIDVEYNVDKPVLAIAHDLPMNRVVYKSDNDDPEYFGAIASECRPLTPPIELIDGKAYQFNYRQGVKGVNGMQGILISSGDIFLTKDGSFCASNCTNIQPLTVKE